MSIPAKKNHRVIYIFFGRQGFSRKEKIVKGIDTAKRILHYMIKGDGKQAARCMRNHLSTTNEDLKDELLQRQFQDEQSQ